MDEYMFGQNVHQCKYVHEDTRYIEIFNYSDSSFDSREEHPLTFDEFENFLHRRGAFEPPNLPDGVKLVNGMRLIVQKDCKQNDTFSPNYITLTPASYQSMVRTFRLSFRGIETSAVVGPFFWSSYDPYDEDPYLQILFRKSDVRKKGKTRGWESTLSHSFNTCITTGFVKGTPSSDVVPSLGHLVQGLASQVGHPLLLPMVLMSYELAPIHEVRQRKARDWLRKLEHAVTGRDEITEEEGYIHNGILDLDGINRDLYECNSQVLWKKPQAYVDAIREVETALKRFTEGVREDVFVKDGLDKAHRSMVSRLEFYRAKLKGMEHYAWTTLERLRVQREALYNITAMRESKLNLQMAKEQKHLAHATKRDGTAMKTLSLLGALLLPPTYLASVFSMTFFNFEAGAEPVVSPWIWTYFAITVPITAAIVGTWVYFDARRKRIFRREKEKVEDDIEVMEHEIMATMRRKTLSKASTWNTISPPKRP